MTEYISCDCKCKFNSATCQCECKNYCKCKEDYSLNPGTCIFENSKYWKIYVILQWSSVMNLSVMDISWTKKRNTIAANVTINCHSEKGRDCYILHAVLLAIMLLLLITVISYHIEKHRSKQKIIDQACQRMACDCTRSHPHTSVFI